MSKKKSNILPERPFEVWPNIGVMEGREGILSLRFGLFLLVDSTSQENSNHDKKRIIGVWDTYLGNSDLPPMLDKKSTKNKRPKKQKKKPPLNSENQPTKKRPKQK
jgi:hypothetical protein